MAMVTKTERDAAADIHLFYNPTSKIHQRAAQKMRSGWCDHDPLIQAFAAHREAILEASNV